MPLAIPYAQQKEDLSMRRNLLYLFTALSTLPFLAGCDEARSAASPAVDAPETVTDSRPGEPSMSTPLQLTSSESTPDVPQPDVLELDWDALIPADWRPEKLMADYDADNLSDDDPRAQELMDKLMALWKESPVVPDLDGKLVKLPGFVVPLEMSTETIGEFLLVPYFGACIHVPPPPANQTVYVVTDKGQEYPGRLFDTVWVTGTLKVEHLSSDLGEAGYRMQAARVKPYE